MVSVTTQQRRFWKTSDMRDKSVPEIDKVRKKEEIWL